MFYRKDAVLMAVAGVLATAGFATAAEVKTQPLSLEPTVVTAADEGTVAPTAEFPHMGLLMQGLGRVGMDKPLNDYGINIYGWAQFGYTYNHRHNRSNASGLITPGPFNHQRGNNIMMNQIDIRIERIVDGTKWDVGGLVELMYGTDSGRIHSSGMGFDGSDFTDNNDPHDPDAVSNFNPRKQFDIPQAYIDIGTPVGVKIRAGKFYTLLGYEHVEAPANTFYSHSYLFNMIPFTQTGILGFYNVNENLSIVGGITRGWDQTLEDGGPTDSSCAIDFLGSVTYKIMPSLTTSLVLSVGPQNEGDTSHYRTAIDSITTWQATDQLSFAGEVLYVYDGGRNGSPGRTHAYGDTWGAALYGTYVINDFASFSARIEKAHYDDGLAPGYSGGSGFSSFGSGNTNFYAITLGMGITPFPKDPIGKNLLIRPEVRYDYCEDDRFGNGTGNTYKDQLTFGADIIFKF
jgi:hypothetical protein